MSENLCKYCGHLESDHAPYGPKKPHERSSLSSKQLASTIKWKLFPIENGPYTLFPTTIEAYCNVILCCACLGFNKPHPTGREVQSVQIPRT